MSQSVFDGYSFGGVEGEQLLQQVDCLVRGIGEELIELFARAAGQSLGHHFIFLLRDHVQLLFGGCPNHLEGQLDLVLGVHAWEEGLSPQELCKYAADGPHVDRLVVVPPREQQLRRAVPSGRHVVRENASLELRM